MKKKIFILILLIIILLILFCLFYTRNINRNENTNNYSNTNTNNYSDINNKENYEIDEIIENTTIQGIAELNHNGYIYIFNGQHFGEFGLEMEEYTRANIDNKNQVCIDYYTLEEYDTSYIEYGDILICTGDLTKYKDRNIDSDLDTKNNSIIVLKSNEYADMKLDILNNIESSANIIQSYVDEGYIYLKYDLESSRTSNESYNFPFAIKAKIDSDTEITGYIEDGKTVKVQYKDLTAFSDELILKSLQIVEN